MAERVRKTAVKKPAVKKENRNRSARTIPIAKRTDWLKMQTAVMDLILRLQQQPQKTPFDLEQWKSPAQLKIALLNYCLGRIDVEQFTSIVKKIFQPIPVESRTDWPELEEEVRGRIDRLRQKPNKRTPRSNKPNIVLNAYIYGDIGDEQAFMLFNEWAGLPVEEQKNLCRLRQQVLAIMARLQQVSENCYGGKKCYLSADDVVADLFKGMLTREQAVTKLNQLIYTEG